MEPRTGWGAAWQERAHAVSFNPQRSYAWWRRTRENFNEFRLFEDHWRELNGRSFVDIGCATGDLFRWLQDRHPEFRYHGYDVSLPAIAQAKEKYPRGEFAVVDAELSDLGLSEPPSVLWSRDVVFHQADPLGFLRRLLQIPSEALVLRLRTRDHGETVGDPEMSRQWHQGHWVPYIVHNFDELIDIVYGMAPAAKIWAVKSYRRLFSAANLVLPEECASPETGTADTAMYISLTGGSAGARELVVSARQDFPSPSVWMRRLRALARRVRSRGR